MKRLLLLGILALSGCTTAGQTDWQKVGLLLQVPDRVYKGTVDGYYYGHQYHPTPPVVQPPIIIQQQAAPYQPMPLMQYRPLPCASCLMQ